MPPVNKFNNKHERQSAEIVTREVWAEMRTLSTLLGQKLNTKKGFDNTRNVWLQLHNTSKAQALLN